METAEEDIDAMIEKYAREFESMERQGDLPGVPEGPFWERAAEEFSKSMPACGEVNMQYDPEGKNRTARVNPEDKFRLLAFLEARREPIQQTSSQIGCSDASDLPEANRKKTKRSGAQGGKGRPKAAKKKD